MYIYIYRILMNICPDKYIYIHIIHRHRHISADPGLGQGRGGTWDNRRCGTCFVMAMALTLSKVVPATIACLCFSGLPSLKCFQRAAQALACPC